ncbi:hypothetical protein BDY21DRAFT_405059, partial [Lineolata rhizophorae]
MVSRQADWMRPVTVHGGAQISRGSGLKTDGAAGVWLRRRQQLSRPALASGGCTFGRVRRGRGNKKPQRANGAPDSWTVRAWTRQEPIAGRRRPRLLVLCVVGLRTAEDDLTGSPTRAWAREGGLLSLLVASRLFSPQHSRIARAGVHWLAQRH